jgi:selenide,water dikinase
MPKKRFTKDDISAFLTRTQMNPRGGCQCKLAGIELEDMLSRVSGNTVQNAALLKSIDHVEDCAILRQVPNVLLVTTDLIPIVGVDLVAAGRIAALHSMSDIYACGGIAKWALVTLIIDSTWPKRFADAVLTGIFSECHQSGVEVVGGQTIIGSEGMAGLSVIGVPRGERVLRKEGGKVGDLLLLSKPLGVGLVLRAYKLGIVGDFDLQTAMAVMTASNEAASVLAIRANVNASTDITGYGLLGHLSEMLPHDMGAILYVGRIPMLPSISSIPPALSQTEWIRNNYEYAVQKHQFVGKTDMSQLAPLLDPQTNGGLLISVSPEAADALIDGGFTVIGQVTGSNEFSLRG